ncbi:MAG TPA: DsbA family protein [Legionellaceae bacterium]|nr:DsbA family protein [Legionellaceae bacterium]
MKQLWSLGVLTATLSMPVIYAATAPLSTENKKQIQEVIHDYLITNPEVLIEASQVLQKKQQEALQAQAKTAITQYGSTLVSGTLTVAGNPNGNVTLVEFFDYQCVHCIKMKPVINELIKKNSNLRVVFKEFPIFGKESELASRVAIVAAKQGKYMQIQSALFNDKHLDEEKIMHIAQEAGMNIDELKKAMNSQEVTDQLEDSRRLAESIHLMGTPAFVIMPTPNGKFKAGTAPAFIPGAASEKTLQDLIDKAAKK